MSTRRCARSMNTMNAMVAIATTTTARMKTVEIAPWRPSSSVWPIAAGKAAMMPAKMIRDEPLPRPREVICSPSHIRNIVPPISVMTQLTRKNRPGSVTTPACPSRPTEMP